MNRRTACRTAAVGLIAGLAGCASFEGPSDEESDTPQPDDDSSDTNMNDDETTEPTDRIDSDRVAGVTFTHTGDCSDPETATVEFLDSEVEAVVTGCIQAHNGCAIPILVGGSDENGTFRVEIGEEDFSDPDTLCTEAIEDQGYELRIRFDPDLPETVEIFHDGAEQSGVVTTASP